MEATHAMTPFQMIPEYQEVEIPYWDVSSRITSIVFTPLSYLASFFMTKRHVPPSAPGHALVGSLPELSAMKGDIMRLIVSYSQKYGKDEGLCKLAIGNQIYYIVMDPTMARSILNNHNSYKRGDSLRIWRKFSEGGLSEGVDTQKYRSQAIHFIGAKNLPNFFPSITQISQQWNTRLILKQNFELFHEAERVGLAVMGEIFFRQTCGVNPFGLDGTHEEVSDLFLQSYRELFEVITSRVVSGISSIPYIGDSLYSWIYPADDKKIQDCKDKLKEILAPLFNKAFETYDETNDEAKRIFTNFGIDPKNVNIEEILDKSLGFLQASFETSSKGIAWILYLLGKDQDFQAKLRGALLARFGDRFPESIEELKEVPLLFKTIKEGLRLYTPFPFLLRDIVNAEKFNGYDIEKGGTFIISPLLLHHNSKVWLDPETFNPERFTDEMLTDTWMTSSTSYLTFLDGIHRCPGRFFADLEIAMVLVHVIKDHRIVLNDPTLVPGLKSNITLHADRAIDVHLE